jgi:hypothetical protein
VAAGSCDVKCGSILFTVLETYDVRGESMWGDERMNHATGEPQTNESGSHVAFAVVFGIVGAMALSKFTDPSSYVIGPGTLAAGALGVAWPVFAVTRKRWDSGNRGTANARLLLWAAGVATVASGVAALIALLFVVQNGLTVDLSAASPGARAARGAWMVWLFPALALALTSVSVFVGIRDVQMVLRHFSSISEPERT